MRKLRQAKLFLLEQNTRASATRSKSLKKSTSMVFSSWDSLCAPDQATSIASYTAHNIYIMYFKTTTFTLHMEKPCLQHYLIYLPLSNWSTLIWDGKKISSFLFLFFYQENIPTGKTISHNIWDFIIFLDILGTAVHRKCMTNLLNALVIIHNTLIK